jgi:hypothetical protein
MHNRGQDSERVIESSEQTVFSIRITMRLEVKFYPKHMVIVLLHVDDVLMIESTPKGENVQNVRRSGVLDFIGVPNFVC